MRFKVGDYVLVDNHPNTLYKISNPLTMGSDTYWECDPICTLEGDPDHHSPPTIVWETQCSEPSPLLLLALISL